MSRQSHSFSVEYAELYGLECAILINHFQFWIEQNQKMGRNFYDGRTWMYQTQAEIAAIYPYWSEDTIFRTIKKLEDFGILVKGNYNKSKMDRTVWYAFKNEEMFTKPQNCGIGGNGGMHTAKTRSPFREIAEAIPDTNTDTNHDDDDSAGAKEDEKKEKPKKIIGQIEYTNHRGEQSKVTRDELVRFLLRYDPDVVKECINRLIKLSHPITDIFEYSESICKQIITSKTKKKEQKTAKEIKEKPNNKEAKRSLEDIIQHNLYEFKFYESRIKELKTTLEQANQHFTKGEIYEAWTEWMRRRANT